MQDLRDLLVHELSVAYDAERGTADALRSIVESVRHPGLAESILDHLDESTEREDRLDTVLRFAEALPESNASPGFRGLLAEIDAVRTAAAPQEVRDLALAHVAARLGRYRASVYEGALDLADRLGLREAAEALEETLSEEEDFVDWLLAEAGRIRLAAAAP